MAKKSEMVETYLFHDLAARQSKELILIIEDMGFEGYGLFWAIAEFMHKNDLKPGEERLIAGKEYVEKIKSILNDYGLFHIENGKYISYRIERNKKKIREKSKQAINAAETKWLLCDFKKYYTEIFGKEPCLEKEDIEALKEYSEKITDLRKLLPDILYTLSEIKFDEKAKKYKPLTNWLLSQHNLSSVYEGTYSNGKLRSWKEEKNRRKQEKEQAALRAAEESLQTKEIFDINNFSGKAEAIEYIIANTKDSFIKQKRLIPPLEQLRKKFDITFKEIEEQKNEI